MDFEVRSAWVWVLALPLVSYEHTPGLLGLELFIFQNWLKTITTHSSTAGRNDRSQNNTDTWRRGDRALHLASRTEHIAGLPSPLASLWASLFGLHCKRSGLSWKNSHPDSARPRSRCFPPPENCSHWAPTPPSKRLPESIASGLQPLTPQRAPPRRTPARPNLCTRWSPIWFYANAWDFSTTLPNFDSALPAPQHAFPMRFFRYPRPSGNLSLSLRVACASTVWRGRVSDADALTDASVCINGYIFAYKFAWYCVCVLLCPLSSNGPYTVLALLIFCMWHCSYANFINTH